MLTLHDELIIKISELLTDNEKIKFTMVSKMMDKMKNKFMYTDKIDVRKIRNLKFFNNFEYVEIPDIIHKCPKNVKHINFVAQRMTPNRFVIKHISMQFDYFFSQFKDGAITSLKSVIIEDNFDNSIKYCLPSSVTHLTFGKHFNQPIESRKMLSHIAFDEQLFENGIPATITHLTFGDNFNQPIKYCLPPSVTHLKFGYFFNQSIKNCIPPSVTHLEFGIFFNRSLNNIPLSVQEIKIYKSYRRIIDALLMPKIMMIEI